MDILNTVFIIVLVVVGLIVLGVVIRIVWFFIEVGMEAAEIRYDLKTERLRKKLKNPNLPAAELPSIAYETRFNLSLVHDEIVQHPSAYPELTVWMNELRTLSQRFDADSVKAVKRLRQPPPPSALTA